MRRTCAMRAPRRYDTLARSHVHVRAAPRTGFPPNLSSGIYSLTRELGTAMLASITRALAPYGVVGTGADSLIDLQRGSTDDWLVQVVQVGERSIPLMF